MTATGSPTAPPFQGPAGELVARFTVDGEPVPKERARVIRENGKTRSYTPDHTAEAEARIGWAFRRAAPRHRPDDETAYAVEALFHPGTHRRRDVDNLLKLVMDALNGIAWADDGQVVRAVTAKAPPGGPPRTEITVYRVGPYPRPTRGGVCESCGGPTSRKTVRRCRTCRTRATPRPGGGAGGGVGGLA